MKYPFYLLLCTIALNLNGQELEMQVSGRLILGSYEERTASIACGDIDGDGLVEIIEANSDDINRYYFNRTKQ